MRMKCGSALMLLALVVPTLHGQVVAPAAAPGVPVAPVSYGAPAFPGGPIPYPPPTGCKANLLACCGICRDAFCASTIGQFMGNGLRPLGALTGGMVGPCCPIVTAADLAQPADSATGAAARVRADEAAAKQRRADVRYLGSVDCRYWPEAKEALINALRADRNECVRLEAAYQLGRGCCCSKATTQALLLSATGGIDDGNPSEPSERVRATAFCSLNSCLSRMSPEIVPIDTKEPLPLPLPKERLPDVPKDKETAQASESAADKANTNLSSYYQRIEKMPLADFTAAAHKALDKMGGAVVTTAPVRPTGGSVLEVIQHASISTPPAAVATPRVTPAPPIAAARPQPLVPVAEKPLPASPFVSQINAAPMRPDWAGPVGSLERSGPGVYGSSPALPVIAQPQVVTSPVSVSQTAVPEQMLPPVDIQLPHQLPPVPTQPLSPLATSNNPVRPINPLTPTIDVLTPINPLVPTIDMYAPLSGSGPQGGCGKAELGAPVSQGPS